MRSRGVRAVSTRVFSLLFSKLGRLTKLATSYLVDLSRPGQGQSGSGDCPQARPGPGAEPRHAMRGGSGEGTEKSSQGTRNESGKPDRCHGIPGQVVSARSPLILYLKRRAFLRPALPAIIEPRGGNVGMPQPLLHFGNVRVMREGIRRCGGTQGMHAEAVHIGVDTHQSAVVPHDLLIHGRWVQVLGKCLANVVFHRPEKRTIKILCMFGFL